MAITGFAKLDPRSEQNTPEAIYLTRPEFGAAFHPVLWDRYFSDDTTVSNSAAATLATSGVFPLDTEPAPPTYATNIQHTYSIDDGVVNQVTTYEENTNLKAAIAAGELSQARASKQAELEDWWKNQTVMIDLPVTAKSTGEEQQGFELSIFEVQRTVNQVQLGQWKILGGTGSLTLVDHQFFSVVIAEDNVVAAETAFREEYEVYGDNWDVKQKAIQDATTVAAVNAIEVLP